MTNNIHPTAHIAPSAVLAKNVTIGAFAVVEENVILGEGCKLDAHVVIKPYVKLGLGNIIHSHVVLGGLPQAINFKATTVSWLKIGDNNTFREGFTAHRALVEHGVTSIGSNCFFMNNSHVAHDCIVGSNTILASNVAIGGFVEVGDNVFMGGTSGVHQFCRIGSYAIVQGTTGINKDVIPYTLIAGKPAKHYCLNTIGLKRAGITGSRYRTLSSAFRLLRKKQSLDGLEQTHELVFLRQWLAATSKRGIHGFVALDKTS